MASEEEEDPEVEFLKSLTTRQKQKLLRWVLCLNVMKPLISCSPCPETAVARFLESKPGVLMFTFLLQKTGSLRKAEGQEKEEQKTEEKKQKKTQEKG